MRSAEADGDTCWASGLEAFRNARNFAMVSNRAQRCFKQVGDRKLRLLFEKEIWSRAPRVVKEEWKNLPPTALRDYGLCESVSRKEEDTDTTPFLGTKTSQSLNICFVLNVTAKQEATVTTVKKVLESRP